MKYDANPIQKLYFFVAFFPSHSSHLVMGDSHSSSSFTVFFVSHSSALLPLLCVCVCVFQSGRGIEWKRLDQTKNDCYCCSCFSPIISLDIPPNSDFREDTKELAETNATKRFLDKSGWSVYFFFFFKKRKNDYFIVLCCEN